MQGGKSNDNDHDSLTALTHTQSRGSKEGCPALYAQYFVAAVRRVAIYVEAAAISIVDTCIYFH